LGARRESLAVGRAQLSIDSQAQQGFSRGAEAYERGRPEYPPEPVAWLADRLELAPGRTVLDVGAGTGKLTRALVPSGARLIAVEPVAEMRAVLERNVSGAEVLDAQAENIPLPDASVNAVVCGQAFHWFDGPVALEEFHRLLRPSRGLGLIWNRRDRDQPLQAAIDEIIQPHRQGTPAYPSRQWGRAFEASPRFALAEEVQFTFEQDLDAAAFLDRVMSISFISALDGPERRAVEDRLRALADEGLEPLRYSTEVFIYSRV
jgi:SAM-dependent methyltransferase